MLHPRGSARRPLQRRRHSGQSVVEFALVVPVLLLILLAIADFGRMYTSAVAVESAGREAADFGAFDATYWNTTNLNNAATRLYGGRRESPRRL